MVPLRTIQFDLTAACPLYCVHCSNSSGPALQREFPIGALVKILPEAKALGATVVVLSGGEPLIYAHLDRALEAAASVGLRPVMFTTGVSDRKSRTAILSSRWAELHQRGLAGACFSVYSGPSRRDFHNNVVQTRPTSGDALEVVEDAIRGAHGAGITVDLHFVPTIETVDDLPGILDWAKSLQCATMHIEIPILQGRNSGSQSLVMNSAAEERLKQFLLNARAHPLDVQISRFWLQRWRMLPQCGCPASLEQLVIRVDGGLSPCNACKYAQQAAPRENVFAAGNSICDLWVKAPSLQLLRSSHSNRARPGTCIPGLLAVACN